jgi:DNA-binding CsgD family transcriptional regulator
MLAEAYEKVDEPDRALRLYREFMELKESLVGEEKRKEILAIEVRYGTERAEREREMFRLRNERLEAENAGKTRELTALAMSLTQTMEVLRGLRENAAMLSRSGGVDARETAEAMIRTIDAAFQEVDGWQQFERQFNLLHPEFLGKLSDRFPDLTPGELKICLLLRINLSTKEIASLLSVSTRAVEGHRYNIRRKLSLSSKAALPTFLASI